MCIRDRRGLAPIPAKGEASAVSQRWRYEENFKACHKEHLRACTQRDWPLLRAHYLRLLGQVAPARVIEQRAATNDVRVAAFKLRQACEEAKDVIAMPAKYIESISRARFGAPPMS